MPVNRLPKSIPFCDLFLWPISDSYALFIIFMKLLHLFCWIQVFLQFNCKTWIESLIHFNCWFIRQHSWRTLTLKCHQKQRILISDSLSDIIMIISSSNWQNVKSAHQGQKARTVQGWLQKHRRKPWWESHHELVWKSCLEQWEPGYCLGQSWGGICGQIEVD